MAKRGVKPEPRAIKQQRGTLQACRDTTTVLETPTGAVVAPHDMPEHAHLIWEEYAPIAENMGTLKPADTATFAQWCVMTADLVSSWQPENTPAPASFVQQWRTLGELFGLAGEKSRVVAKVIDDSGSKNPFARHGRR